METESVETESVETESVLAFVHVPVFRRSMVFRQRNSSRVSTLTGKSPKAYTTSAGAQFER